MILLASLLPLLPSRMLGQATGDSTGASRFLPAWNFMSLSTSGVDTFQLDHPTFDGRGVVVMIFDTGVDPSIPGLGSRSTGETKVVDLVDVSGSNLLHYLPARISGDELTADGVDAALSDFRSISPQPVDNTWYIAVMDESKYQNAGVRDFDGDGESNTMFGSLLYRADDGWRVVVDADGDGSMAGEKSMRSYREGHETFTFRQKFDYVVSPVTVGAGINPDRKEVVFHYDMNGHGTHVAGIVSGYAINDESGFNGVAPGVEIISVKFASDMDGDLTVAGSMRRAYDYAAHAADSLEAEGKPLVVNMSFGIGSAYEGKAEMEEYINNLLPEHRNLYVVTSAGNEGPGLSSIGIPAAASQLITVGALLPEGIGRDSYGAAIDRDIVWDFSSRGGEVDKPDVIAPGTAVSTIPRFSFDMKASGTSMASPYTAGIVAVLLSSAKQTWPGWRPGQGVMRRLLRSSATRLPGYAPIEQGSGVVNVRRAWDLLQRWKQDGFADSHEEYRIETFLPSFPDGEGSAAFWRSPYVPDQDWRQEFHISRITSSEDESSTAPPFFRPFTLESTVPWMKPIQKTVYIRGNDNATVEVVYDRTKLKEPGLYSGYIIARRAQGRGATPADEIEFQLLNTIIVPYLFSPTSDYRVTTGTEKLKPGEEKRYYFAMPPGASGLSFELSSPKGSGGVISGTVVDRNGVTQTYLAQVNGKDRLSRTTLASDQELQDGVIEVVIKADPFEGSGREGEFSLTAEALMLQMTTDIEEGDERDNLVVELRNGGTQPINGELEYTLKGYARTIHDTIRENVLRRPIKLGANDGALWVAGQFAPEEYMKATDIMIRLVDSSGRSQAEEVYNTPDAWVFLPNFYRDGKDRWYFLEMVFGAADPSTGEESDVNVNDMGSDGDDGWNEDDDDSGGGIPVTIYEHHVRPTDFERLSDRNSRVIYPAIPRRLSGELPLLKGGIPAGYQGLGEIRFSVDGDEDRSVVREFYLPMKR